MTIGDKRFVHGRILVRRWTVATTPRTVGCRREELVAGRTEPGRWNVDMVAAERGQDVFSRTRCSVRVGRTRCYRRPHRFSPHCALVYPRANSTVPTSMSEPPSSGVLTVVLGSARTTSAIPATRTTTPASVTGSKNTNPRYSRSEYLGSSESDTVDTYALPAGRSVSPSWTRASSGSISSASSPVFDRSIPTFPPSSIRSTRSVVRRSCRMPS